MKRTIFAALMMCILLGGVSCSSAKKRTRSETSTGGAVDVGVQDMGPSPSVYPPGESVGPQPPVSYGPAPVQKKGIVLVLGAGAARGFAHIGVLLALDELKIPIEQIYGEEMGALFGAMYTLSKTKNDFEWQSQKYQADTFAEGGLSKWLKSTPGAKIPARLRNQLEKTFSEKKMDAPVRGHVAFLIQGHVVEQGKVSERIQESFEETGDAAVAERLNGDQRVLWIDLGDAQKAKKTSLKQWLKSEQNLLVIQPELKGFGFEDYAARTEIIYRGKQAIMKKAELIKKWIEP